MNTQNYWRVFQITIGLTFLGGLTTLLIRRSSASACSVTQTNINTLVVQYSLPILTFVVAFLVLGTLRSSVNESKLRISKAQVGVWLTTGFLLSFSVFFIDGITVTSRLFLSLSLFVFLSTMLLYFVFLIEAIFSQRIVLSSAVLLLPGLINAFRDCLSLDSPAQEVLIQAGINLLCTLLLIGSRSMRGGRITFEKEAFLKPRRTVLSVLTIALFLGGITIPVRMDYDAKIDYLSVIASSRLPIFAVFTFLLIASPMFIASPHNTFSRLIVQRRIGVMTVLIAMTSLVTVTLFVVVNGVTESQMGLTFLVVFASTMLSLILPWVMIRLRENRLDTVDVLSLVTTGSVILMFRTSATAWQLSSLVATLLLALVLSVRHWIKSKRKLQAMDHRLNSSPDEPVELLASVIIPSYNPGVEVLRTVSRVRQELHDSSIAFEVIVVSDGSTDESIALLEQSSEVDHHVWLRTNHGKGAALREGFAHGKGTVMCFIDADGDLDPSVLPSMILAVFNGDVDVVYGSKMHPLSNVQMSKSRKAISSGFRALVKVLFRFDVTDTQTGIKVYSSSLIRDALPLSNENGFNIDLELFVVAHALGYRRFMGHHIVLHRRGSSSVGLATVIKMFVSTMRLFRRRTLTLDYVPVRERAELCE